ncbi:MAG: DUF177 domain-containing protein [Rubrivivax sp.]|nr:DUF177 domain-containing protein [Rubrivivax sp.]
MARSSRRTHAPLALDVAAFCREGAHLHGRWALAELPRLAESVLRSADGAPLPAPAGANGDAAADDGVVWSAGGTTLRLAGGVEHCAIDLDLHAIVGLECQRCLQPMAVPLVVQRRIRFVDDEEEAARLDEELEDDVLAMPSRLDLRALVEDELLLAMPLVPRHEACPQPPAALQAEGGAAPGAVPRGAGDDASPAPHPFAALRALRRPKPTEG